MILDIYPTTDESSYKLYEDDGATRNYLSEDAWCLTVYTLRRVGNDVNFQIHQAECGNESKFNVPESRRYYCTFRHIATAPEQITMNEGLLDRVDGLDALDQNDECFFYESESRTLHVRFIAASYEVSDVWFTGDWATKTRSQEPQRTTPAQIRKSKMSIKIEGSGSLSALVFDAAGRTLKKWEGKEYLNLSLPRGNGLYLLEVRQNGNIVSRERHVHAE